MEHLRRELRNIADSDRREAQLELARILASDHFRGSQRSCKFLQHVMAKGLAGEFDAIKERILGIEILGRDSMFDTERDAVVRVTANDVRKRLKQYYQAIPGSRVRIALLPGTYIPQIAVAPPPPAPLPAASVQPPVAAAWMGRPVLPIALGLALLLLIALSWTIFAWSAPAATKDVLPWSALLKPGHRVDLVVADANLLIAKFRSHEEVPIGIYSSHNFQYAPDLQGPFGSFLNITSLTTASDARIASRISDLAAHAGSSVQLRYCNRVDVGDLKRPESMIFLGSSTSNPWVGLFSDKLNFQIVHRQDTDTDVCLNRQPKSGELPVYVPTPRGAALSVGYATVALTPNLSGQAPVLLIAGTTTEGTEAAGDFVMNLDHLSDALKKIGLHRRASLQHLELLIRTSFVSAASVTSEVVAYRVH